MTTAMELVGQYTKAVGAGDFAAARRLLDDDLKFEGPLETFSSPEPFLDSLERLSGIIERIVPIKMFGDGSDVCVLYDMVTNTAAGTAFVAEWYQTNRSKISSIRVVFDARPFAAMFGKKPV
jgi:hypothetical protein